MKHEETKHEINEANLENALRNMLRKFIQDFPNLDEEKAYKHNKIVSALKLYPGMGVYLFESAQ